MADWITSPTKRSKPYVLLFHFISRITNNHNFDAMLFSPKLFSQVKQQISTDQVTSMHKGADWLWLVQQHYNHGGTIFWSSSQRRRVS